jgi:hypothetical protein
MGFDGVTVLFSFLGGRFFALGGLLGASKLGTY